MKTLLSRLAGRRACGCGVPLTTTLLLLAPISTRADTAYTATGWLTGVPVLPIVCTTGAGQVLLRGNAHTIRVVSSDPHLTGSRVVFANGSYQADGTALIYGTAYQEVGTFDASNSFTPSGGLWEITYRGVMQTDYSLALSLVGYGSGGAIDGMRIQEALTRGPASGPIDPAVPYLYTGTIKPAPVNTREVVDNFDTPPLSGWTMYGGGSSTISEANQQFIARGHFPGVHTISILDSYVLGASAKSWTVPDGRTREWRADLVTLDDNATNTAILAAGTGSGMYAFHLSRDFLYVLKWPTTSGGFSIFACEKAAVRNVNVVLALALTRVQPNLVVTARVLDKADPNTVLYQRSVVDTPSSDPALTTAQFQALTGMRLLDLTADVAGPPFTSFGTIAGMYQYTDGTQPAGRAIFDNVEVRTSETPLVGIERAVSLSWPLSSTINYTVEGAPTLQGPWLPVQDPAVPGFERMTVPANEWMQFFRLQQAP